MTPKDPMLCPVCLAPHVNGERFVPDLNNPPKVRDFATCALHQGQKDQGYIFLIGAMPKNPEGLEHGKAVAEIDMKRTGEYIGIHKEDAKALFGDFPLVDDIAFVATEVITTLRKLSEGEEESNAPHP